MDKFILRLVNEWMSVFACDSISLQLLDCGIKFVILLFVECLHVALKHSSASIQVSFMDKERIYDVIDRRHFT